MNFNLTKERCLHLAELEGDTTIGAGSLLSLEQLHEPRPKTDSAELNIVRGVAFGRFVEMKRRDLGLSVEQLAERAGIETSEAVSIEEDTHYHPEPTAILQIAKVFQMPHKGLMQLAGLIHAKSERFIRETTKFAARSESSTRLTEAERDLLEHYAAVLAEDT
jgi:HTH-type transcriptional regulator, competence development regulator